MNFGKTILELRKKKNVTQDEMAAELGVTATAVSKWENGYSLPDILMLCALADYFQVTTDELLGRAAAVKYAVIAAQTQELGKQIEALAKQHGILTRGIYENYLDALAAAKADGSVTHLLAGYHNSLTREESDAELEPLRLWVSIGETPQKILDGFDYIFKNMMA